MIATHRAMARLIATAALAGTGFLCGSIVRAQWLDASTSPAPAAALAIDSTADLVAGAPHAHVTVRIFGDYECHACRDLDLAIGDTLLSLAHAGRLRLVYFHRPLATRQDAELAAAAVACAPGSELRWATHRQLYQPDHTTPRHAPASLAERVLSLAGDNAELLRCIRSDSLLAHVRRSIATARAAGFHEVPTVLVNDEHVHFRSHTALLRHIRRTLTRELAPPG